MLETSDPTAPSVSSFAATETQTDCESSLLQRLNLLTVKPVCVTVRRSIAVSSQHESAQDAQKRISVVSWNKKPNQGGEKWTKAPGAASSQIQTSSIPSTADSNVDAESAQLPSTGTLEIDEKNVIKSPIAAVAATTTSSSKKMKVRRNPNEVRSKGSSKYSKLWKNLKKPIKKKE